MISRIRIRINPPAEMYIPFPRSFSLCLIERTSFRRRFFSMGFKSVLVIVFISSNLVNKVLASAASFDFEATAATLVELFTAIDLIGQNDNDKHVISKKSVVFFIEFF